MNALRSGLFALIFYGITALAVLVALPFGLAGGRPLRRIVRLWAGFHRWCARHILGIAVRVEGTAPVSPSLVAAKHESMFETVELVLLLREPVIVLKRELADIPGWGWLARRYGVIAIDRAAGPAALRGLLRAGERARATGRHILIFPEGTRVPPGAAPALLPGFAGLYRALALPVVPVALDSGRLWPRRSFVKRPGIVTFRFGEPIAPGLERREAERAVHAKINALGLSPPGNP